MKQIGFIILIVLLAAAQSCTTSKKVTDDSDFMNKRDVNMWAGSSYETAVVIDKSNETEGIKAEYDWIKEHYPGSQVLEQSLNYYKDKPYDIIQITDQKGENKRIYFDISKFFGKF
jgi:hypothetical protein